MTNIIGYNQLPNFDEFKSLYELKSQSELAEHYKCTKKRINKWIKHFELNLRPQGGGNNRKYNIDESVLRELVVSDLSIDEICIQLNIKRSSLYNWMKKFNIRRIRDTTDYKKYQRKVRWLTEKTYVDYKNFINPHNHPRTLCGVDGGYQLDHIIGVYECYISGTSIENCSDLKNLQMIPWKENLEKRNYNNYNRGFKNES
jgi:transposase